MAVSTKIPGGIYSGGAVVVNSEPIAQMYEQYTQRAMARDQALDNYFRDLNKTVNPAGMRNQDIPAYIQKQKDWNQFYMQNKQAIKNPRLDNGKAYSEYQGRYNDMINHIDQSKNAAKMSDELSKARLNPQLGYIFDDNEVMDKIHQHDLPLTDPNHKNLSIAELAIQPKPLSVKDMEDLNKTWTTGIKPVDTVTGTKVDPTTLDTITSYKRNYSTEDLQAVGNRAKYSYQLNRSLRSTTDKNLLNSPDAPQLNELYKSVYGKNAESPADLLAAQAIQNVQTQSTYDKRTPGSFEAKRRLEQLKQLNRNELIDRRHTYSQGDKQMDDVWVDTYANKLINDANKSDFQTFKIGGQDFYEKPVSLDPVVAKALARGGVEPDMVTVGKNNSIRGIYYSYDKNKTLANGKPNPDYGKPLGIDEDLSRNVFSPEQLKLAISGKTQSAKQRAQEMQPNTGQQQFVVPKTHKGMLD